MTLTQKTPATATPVPVARSSRERGRSVVWLDGEHDLGTELELTRVLASVIAHDDGDLVLDLGAVQFMDASTLGAILRSRNELRLQSRSLIVRSPSAFATRFLSLCGLDEIFEPDR